MYYVITNRHLQDKIKSVGGKTFLISDIERIISKPKELTGIYSLAARSELMGRACDFDEFKELDLDSSSMTFFQNNLLLVRFFQELAVENVSLDQISNMDAYEQYADHIDILSRVLMRYLTILEREKCADMISIPMGWSGQVESDIYVKSGEKVFFAYDGIMSKFDNKIIRTFAHQVFLSGSEFLMTIKTNDFNLENFNEILHGFNLESNNVYTFTYSGDQFELKDKMNSPIENINGVHAGVTLPTIGAISVAKEVQELILSGVKSNDIGVVYTSSLNRDLLLNYAKDLFINRSGVSLKDSELYKVFCAMFGATQDPSLMDKESKSYVLKRYFEEKKASPELFKNLLENIDHEEVGFHLLDILVKIMDFYSIEYDIDPDVEDEFFGIIENLYSEIIRFGNVSVGKFMEMILLDAESRLVFDRSESSKVGMYDFWDARGLSFKHLFVVGFDRENVPYRSKKDVFLDSAIRTDSDLPIYRDRILLQKNYWFNLFSKAESIYVTYQDGNNSAPSAFLNDYSFEKINVDDSDLIGLKFNTNENSLTSYGFKENVSSEPFAGLMSKSKLSDWLTCRRKFFYKHIAKIAEPKTSVGYENIEIGNIVHKIVEDLTPIAPTVTPEQFVQIGIGSFKKSIPSGYKYDFLSEKWIPILESYLEKLFEELSNIDGKSFPEQKITGKIGNFDFTARIDRLDQFSDGSMEIVDYKSGKKPNLRVTGQGETDFQVEIYSALVKQKFNVDPAFTYDLIATGIKYPFQSDKRREDALMDALEKFSEEDGTYPLNEKDDKCRFCPYTELCGK